MSWILAVYLHSVDGSFVREFDSEKECVKVMREVVSKELNNPDIRRISCTPAIMVSEDDSE